MKYLKLYEEFKYDQQIEYPDLSDKTVDDLDNILSEVEDDGLELESEEVRRDSKGVYHIKNWKVY